jgi:hypothetical protein
MSSYGENPFSLSILESGKCPWTAASSKTVDWLPPRPLHSAELSAVFQSNMQSIKTEPSLRKQSSENAAQAVTRHIQSTVSSFNKRHSIPRTSNNVGNNQLITTDTRVVIWYEHISKSGGTTFCALARSNMPYGSVPPQCRPSKGDSIDGRVGSWPNDELVEFILGSPYGILSNEWDPFDAEKLKLSERDVFGNSTSNNLSSPSLLFVTTLRDPADRLLSSFTFFSKFSNEQQSNTTKFGVWMKRNYGRVHEFKVGGKSAFQSNIARNNYMVWRFSGCDMPHYNHDDDSEFFFAQSKIFPSSAINKSAWKNHFETAIRALSCHDLVIPIDVLTQESGKQSLRQLLGWTRFAVEGKGSVGKKESGHVVSIAGVGRNSNAREYLLARETVNEFRALWERNWLDYILFYWARAVFFARLYCNISDNHT